MKQSTKNYFTQILKIRTAYHAILGLDIGYICYLIGFNLKNFPVTKGSETNIFFLGINFIAGFVICWLWDRWQIIKLKVQNADIKVDTIKQIITGVFAVLGGLLGMIYASWYVAIPLTVLSAYLVTKHYKK